jgi:hypothetical protein
MRQLLICDWAIAVRHQSSNIKSSHMSSWLYRLDTKHFGKKVESYRIPDDTHLIIQHRLLEGIMQTNI